MATDGTPSGNLRPFKPGAEWRGNPGGRPKGLGRYIRSVLGEDGAVLANFFLNVFADRSRSHRDRFEAATWLADRGWGKPAQALTGPDGQALQLAPDLIRLQLVLVEALAAYPEARIAVAEALAALEASGAEDEGEVPF